MEYATFFNSVHTRDLTVTLFGRFRSINTSNTQEKATKVRIINKRH